MILSAIHNAFKKAKERGWDNSYFAIDIHDTIVEANYKVNDIPTTFYPFAKEVLQLLTQREDVKLILFTCSHPHEIDLYIKFFNENGIQFDYINENPDVQTDLNGYGNYDKKFYFNVLMDDKAGFNPLLEWEAIYWYLTPQDDRPYITKMNPSIKVVHKYNPNYGDNKECICGHPYYRHFDTYEDMAPIGCKYCSCRTFVDASTLKIEAKLECHSGTTYKEIWDFVNQHKGKRAKIHFKLKGFTEWGNDEDEVVILDEYGIWWLQNYMGTEEEYRKTNDAYIHNITIYS
jgi:hypothetical protein